ncbi:MAG: LysR family transcriptional regulator [Trueperaceae bacterium]|nr:LysR family transcriptional regulator [Trueperaceae bacterium]
MLEADHLITFATVAKLESLSLAAEHLYKSQPAISNQLKRLQEAVGEPLYTRHRYGIRLTSTGEALLPFAQTLTRTLEAARHYVHELRVGQTGQLSIAASTTIAMYYLPKQLKLFQEEMPGIELRLITCNTQEAVHLLTEGSADLALIEGPLQNSRLEQRQIAQDEIMLAVLPEHPFAGKKVLQLAELNGLEVVRRESGSGTRAVVDAVLNPAGIRPKTVLEAKGVDAVKEAVLQGFGAAFLSKLALEREVSMGLLKALRIDKGLIRPLSMVHAGLELCSQTTRSFIQFLETNQQRIEAQPSE